MSRFEREGEATLTIHDAENRLASLTFSIMAFQKKQILFICGLQGASRSTSHNVIKEATKACHGLFPKRLLVEMLQLISGEIGAPQIIAVGDKSHVFQSARYRGSKQKVFLAITMIFGPRWKALRLREGFTHCRSESPVNPSTIFQARNAPSIAGDLPCWRTCKRNSLRLFIPRRHNRRTPPARGGRFYRLTQNTTGCPGRRANAGGVRRQAACAGTGFTASSARLLFRLSEWA